MDLFLFHLMASEANVDTFSITKIVRGKNVKVKHSFIILFIFSMLFIGGCSSSSSADWNSNFVVWDNYMYETTEEYVSEIDKEIGHVTKYSDREGMYSGNFSNKYKKGTEYYSIKGTNTVEAIAIKEEDGRYRKAVRAGKYGEK